MTMPLNDNAGPAISYADLIGILSFVIGLQNLAENEQQSAHTEALIRQIDVDEANDKQARVLLAEIDKKFDEQNAMLRRMLEILEGTVNKGGTP